MSKLKHYSLFLVFVIFLLSLLVSSCNDVINENVEALYSSGALDTKSVAVVCVDLYVDWDGKFIYLGSACNTGAGGGGAAGGVTGSIMDGHNRGDVFESPPYNSGGTPSGGEALSIITPQQESRSINLSF